MKTTLNKIRANSPCAGGWKKLLTHLGKTKADDESLSIITVLDSNGLDDALWCLRAVDGHEKEIRLYAVWCARKVQHLMTDSRSIDALDVAERYAYGQATDSELKAAGDAARAVAMVAACSAGAAAGAAARSASLTAAKDAGAAAGDAAWEAERAAAGAAQAQELRRLCAEIELKETK